MALLLFLYSLHSQYFFPLALVQTSISSRYLMIVHQPDKLKKKKNLSVNNLDKCVFSLSCVPSTILIP